MSRLDRSAFEAWLRAYGAAWEGRDPPAAAQLFSAEAQYHWTPFDPPQRGRDEIAAAWKAAVTNQQDVQFSFDVLATGETTGIAHWHTRFVAIQTGEPVELDGILSAEFDAQQRCRVFREWWHVRGDSG